MDFPFLISTMQKLLAATPTTLELFILSIFFGGILALLIVWMRVGRNVILRNFAKGYIFVFRGSPLLIQMFLVFYGLGQFGVIRHSFVWPVLREPFACAVLSLALCTGGYTAEIFRSGLRAVPVGEVEAARAAGMSGFKLFRRIIGPIALRHALPAYSTEIVLMVKSTALASLVTVWEITGVAQRLISQTYRTMEVFTCAAALYLILNFVILQGLAMIEHRLNAHQRRPKTTVGTPKTSLSAPRS
jgi:octopine/nopaline transport system permease protein